MNKQTQKHESGIFRHRRLFLQKKNFRRGSLEKTSDMLAWFFKMALYWWKWILKFSFKLNKLGSKDKPTLNCSSQDFKKRRALAGAQWAEELLTASEVRDSNTTAMGKIFRKISWSIATKVKTMIKYETCLKRLREMSETNILAKQIKLDF